MPPRIIIGVKRAGSALRPAIIFSFIVAAMGFLISRHLKITNKIIIISNTQPGRTPAANVLETGTFVSALNNIAALEGGISASNNAADAAKTITKGFG